MNFFLILKHFLIEEIRLNLRRLKLIYSFFKEFSIFRYFIYLFNNSFIPCRDTVFRNYIYENSQKWKDQNNLLNSNNKIILIPCVFNHPLYLVTEILVAKNLMKMFHSNGAAVIDGYDLKKIILFRSFGIKKIIILKDFNIFVRLKYFIKAYLIIKSYKNIDEFLNFNINNVDIGKAAYDHYLRFSGMGTTNEFNHEIYANLYKSLLIYYQVDEYFKKYNIIASVQSERQFIPGAIFFQSALVNGIKVYAKVGHAYNKFCIRRYSNINERYTQRGRFSKKLYDLINKNIRKEAVEIGDKIIKKRFENVTKYNTSQYQEFYGLPEFTKGKKKVEIEKKNTTKEDLCKRFGWSHNSPIATIFSTDLTDGVFDSSWSLFRDRLTWLRETLYEIKKITNVNWLVKPHPNDELNNVITNTVSEFEKICSNSNHIKLFPNDITIGSIPKFINAAITLQGSAGSEYPCFGIPVVCTSESIFTGMGYTIDPQSKKEYFFHLQNIKKLKKLSDQQMELAKIYFFIYYKLADIKINLIAASGSRNVDEKKFWASMTKLLNEYNYNEELLIEMLRIQESNNDMHAINYKEYPMLIGTKVK